MGSSGQGVSASGDLQRDEASLEVLLEEDALLSLGPLDVVFRHVDLSLEAVRNGGEQVEERADCESEGRWSVRSSPAPHSIEGVS